MNGTISIIEKCEEVLNQHPVTTDEVAVEIGEHILAVRPSIRMLYKNNKIIKTGDKRRNISGKFAHVWAGRSVKIDIGTKAITVPPVTLTLVRQAKELGFTSDEVRTMLNEVPNEILTMAIKEIYN